MLVERCVAFRTLFLLALTCGCLGRRVKDRQPLPVDSSDSPVDDQDDGKPEVDIKQCAEKLIRFGKLHNQDLSGLVGRDPYFPLELSSIAEPGTTCGDSAQGISESCEKFNIWRTYQDVASWMQRSPKVLGRSGVHYAHIRQGQLGNCYFLAGLAAVAVNHPEIIENMFVERDLWGANIFKTKWLMHGKSQTLAVDNFLPAKEYQVFFTQPSIDSEFWPIILAKTWAKAFGSFKAAEGGDAREVIKDITRAPSEYVVLREHTEESLWTLLRDCIKNRYAMSSGTSGGNPGPYKLANGHAYAVLDAFDLPEYGKVVKMFNPWNRNNYVGAVPNNKAINGRVRGVFTMNLTEYHDAFFDLTINYIKPEYKAISTMMSPGSLNTAELNISTPGKFWVSIVWPSKRLVRPCEPLDVRFTLNVESKNAKGQLVGTQLGRTIGQNDIVVAVENLEGGVYNVLAGTTLPDDSSWIDQVSLTVYAPGEPNIQESSETSGEMALEMLGPVDNGQACLVATLANEGTFVADLEKPNALGIPTFWSVDRSSFVYYVDGEDAWWLSSAKRYAEVQAGTLWHRKSFVKANFSCGCNDAADGIPGFSEPVPCHLATNARAKYSNVRCFDTDFSYAVQRYCPETCDLCGHLAPSPEDHRPEVIEAASYSPRKASRGDRSWYVEGQSVEYFSSHKNKYMRCHVMKVRSDGSLELSVKPGSWMLPATVKARVRVAAVGSREQDDSQAPRRPFKCEHVRGATDRKGLLTWGQGSCKCKDRAYALGKDCLSGDLFGRRKFSKMTLQTLTVEQLASCKCEQHAGSG